MLIFPFLFLQSINMIPGPLPQQRGVNFLKNIYPWYKLYVMYKIHLGLNQLILMDVI